MCIHVYPNRSIIDVFKYIYRIKFDSQLFLSRSNIYWYHIFLLHLIILSVGNIRLQQDLSMIKNNTFQNVKLDVTRTDIST